MARFVLITSVVIGRDRQLAGTIFDDVSDPSTVNRLRNTGANLVPLPNAILEAAAARASARRLAGATSVELDAIMLAAGSDNAVAFASGLVIDADSQLTWWLDAVNGDDANSGESEGAALKSFKELRRRLGNNFLVDNVEVRIYVNPGTYADGLDLSARFTGADAAIIITGIPEVIHSGIISEFNWPTSGSEPGVSGRFKDQAGTNFSTDGRGGNRLHFDPGGSNDSVAFFVLHPDGYASGRVAVAGAVKRQSGPGQTFSCVGSFFGSTPYVLEQLPKLPGINLTVERVDIGRTGFNDKQTFFIENLAFALDGGQTICTVRWDGNVDQFNSMPVLFYGCSFAGDMFGPGWCLYGCGFVAPGSVGGGVNINNAYMALRACVGHFAIFYNSDVAMRGAEGPSNCQFETLKFEDSRSIDWIDSGLTAAVFGSTDVRIGAKSEIRFTDLWGENTSGDAYNGGAAITVAGKLWYTNQPTRKAGPNFGTPPNDRVTIGSTGGGSGGGGIRLPYAALPFHDEVVDGVGGTDAMIAKAPPL